VKKFLLNLFGIEETTVKGRKWKLFIMPEKSVYDFKRET